MSPPPSDDELDAEAGANHGDTMSDISMSSDVLPPQETENRVATGDDGHECHGCADKTVAIADLQEAIDNEKVTQTQTLSSVNIPRLGQARRCCQRLRRAHHQQQRVA